MLWQAEEAGAGLPPRPPVALASLASAKESEHVPSSFRVSKSGIDPEFAAAVPFTSPFEGMPAYRGHCRNASTGSLRDDYDTSTDDNDASQGVHGSGLTLSRRLWAVLMHAAAT